MSDQKDARPRLPDELDEKIEHVLLDDDVERGGRLVGDQQGRPQEHCRSDADALAHAPGELMRVAVERGRGIGDPHSGQHLDHPFAAGRIVELFMKFQSLRHLAADLHRRVEAGHRLLEDHCDSDSADGAKRRFVEPEQVRSPIQSAPAGHSSAVGQEAQKAPRRDRLSRSGLSDQGKDLAPGDLERQLLDDGAVVEGDADLLDAEDRFAGHDSAIRGSNRSRSASPNRLTPSTAIEMASPGKMASHGAKVK